MDENIQVNFKPSTVNGLFNELNEMKKKKSHLEDAIEIKTRKIIDEIEKNGNMIAYKFDVPYVLSIGTKNSIKLNKEDLAHDVGVSQSELNLIGVAELVESKKLTSDQIKSAQYAESKRVLKARKASKKEVDVLGIRAL